MKEIVLGYMVAAILLAIYNDIIYLLNLHLPEIFLKVTLGLLGCFFVGRIILLIVATIVLKKYWKENI